LPDGKRILGREKFLKENKFNPSSMARILVIDDDEDARAVLRRMLEAAGHSVLLASNGAEGLKLQRISKSDVVITDIFMPEKEGLETIRELKDLDPEIAIIAISGGGKSLSATGSLQTAHTLGAEVLVKPFGSANLLAAIGKLLKRTVC
jgi:CheY-like chemotaxis protein